ncbi:hypothetical protein [uncultured Polaribacter sp.]|uniref:hypothetical protein n=1 Tax=uncultured Polaribacter sp. TaxID=174711 RepID=UPI00259B3293|nr:hypothetical protein [uncultured Polaribacter sp.]
MNLEEKQTIQKEVESIRKKAIIKDYGDVVIEKGEVLRIKSYNSKFKTLTLRDGAILEIDNKGRRGVPFVLIINHLYLDSLEETSFLRFSEEHSPQNLNGSHGKSGATARDGYWTGGGWGSRRRKIAAGNGYQGYQGEHGINIATRGILHFSIKRLWVTDETFLSSEIFQIDGIGFDGGNGGNGGRGGKGGNGAPGISGRHSCNNGPLRNRCRCDRQIRSGGKGGNSGAGGFPGNGAHGGSGATLLFYGKKWLYNTLKTLTNLEGGKLGEGGYGGSSGPVGIGASSVHGGGGHCGRRHPKMSDGQKGLDRSNIRGENGNPGVSGSLIRTRTEPVYSEILDEILDDLEKEVGMFSEKIE